MEKHTIRPATSDDYNDICTLFNDKDELFLIYPKGSHPFTLLQLESLARERIELTVMSHDAYIIGFANLYNHIPSTHAFIGNVVIHKNYRGKGLGKEMIEHMLQQAIEKYALPEIRISVFNNNTPALLLYKHFGFTPYAIEERLNPHGHKVALIHLSLQSATHLKPS